MAESFSSSIKRKNNMGDKIAEIGKQFDTLWRQKVEITIAQIIRYISFYYVKFSSIKHFFCNILLVIIWNYSDLYRLSFLHRICCGAQNQCILRLDINNVLKLETNNYNSFRASILLYNKRIMEILWNDFLFYFRL